MSRLALAFASLVALAACATAPPEPPPDNSVSYQSGYADGCSTGTARSKIWDKSLVRNDDAYGRDTMYKRGWNAGYRSCGSVATRGDPDAEPAGNWENRGPLN